MSRIFKARTIIYDSMDCVAGLKGKRGGGGGGGGGGARGEGGGGGGGGG